MEGYQAKQNGKSPYDYMNKQIAESSVGSNGIIFLPYMLGERAPRWDPDAKGAWIGLKPENTRGDLLRSVLEGVTMNLDIILEILKKQTDIPEITVLGGGAKGQVWRQIMADIFNTRIIVPNVLEEAGAMGAAVTAGVGVGIYKDFHAIDSFIERQYIVEPDPEAATAYVPVKEIFNDSYYSLGKVFEKMSKHV